MCELSVAYFKGFCVFRFELAFQYKGFDPSPKYSFDLWIFAICIPSIFKASYLYGSYGTFTACQDMRKSLGKLFQQWGSKL